MFVPFTYNTTIVQNKNSKQIILYNTQDKILLPINKKMKIYFDINTNCIFFWKWTLRVDGNHTINSINKSFYFFKNFFFEKIKFKGKGFRVRFKKKNKMLRFMFGHSHINISFVNEKKTKIKRMSKYKYMFKCRNQIKMNIFLKKICNIKPINMYTKRGIRLGKQVIYKRKGKKSTYI